MPTTRHLFDTGKLWVANTGSTDVATMVDNNLITELQSIAFDGSYQKADMMTAASVSKFAVDVAFHGGQSKLSIKTGQFEASLLPRLLGATVDGAPPAGFTKYNVGGTSTPVFFKLIFEGLDTNGKRMRIIMENASAPGIKQSFALGQWAMPDFEAEGYEKGGLPAYSILTEN